MAVRHHYPQTIEEAVALARAAQVESGTAQALLAHLTDQSRARMIAYPETPLPPDIARAFTSLLNRAAQGEPLAYLTGKQSFYGLDFAVNRDVLIPRPETEELVDHALGWLSANPDQPVTVADVGTGSGIIAVTLALKAPDVHITATDSSPDALAIARQNAERHGVAERISYVQDNLLENTLGPFNLIVANLPYVDSRLLDTLPVAHWEPRLALDGGLAGLAVIQTLIHQAASRLAAGGLMLLEIGYDQGQKVAELAHASFPAAQVSVHLDLAGLDRIARISLV